MAWSLVTVAIVSCAEGGNGDAPTVLQWQPCEQDVECTTLAVPLDPGDPEGRSIMLALARRSASGPERHGVVLMNPGGPGASGVNALSNLILPEPLGESFDVISWDSRGVGGSTPLDCDTDELKTQWLSLMRERPANSPAERAHVEAAARAMAEACASGDQALLAHMGTGYIVEDMHRIVQALGEPVHYWGVSHGTLIGQRFLEAYPGDLRSVLLDGVVPARVDGEALAVAQAAGFDRALGNVSAACAEGQLACPATDVGTYFDAVADKLRDAPLLSPDGQPVGLAELNIALRMSLYNEQLWSGLLVGLEAADNANGSVVLQLADLYRSLADFAAYYATRCNDAPALDATGYHALADGLAASSPRFGTFLAYDQLPCAYWPYLSPRQPAPIGAPDAVDVPLAVVSVTGDPATPPEMGALAAADLGVPHVLVDGGYHGAVGTHACADAWLTRLLLDPEDANITAICDVD